MRITLVSVIVMGWVISSAAAADPTYWGEVRPLLRKHCTVCHSQRHLNEPEISAGLALDSLEAIAKGGRVPVLVKGKPAESPLVTLLTSKNKNRRMPLDADPLDPAAIEVLTRWVATGAKEGVKPADDTRPVVTRPAGPVRKLDVVVPLTTSVAVGGKPAKLELAIKAGPLSPIAAVAFSPDGKWLATGTYGQAVVWDLTEVKPVKVLSNVLGAVNDLRFSPDGQLLAVAGGQPSARGDLRLFETATWKLKATLGGHLDTVAQVAFSPDGKRLASASFDKTARVWDLATGNVVQTFTGHSDFVYAVAFGPKGDWIVSTGKDKSVQMRDVATGASKLTFSGSTDEVLGVAVSPDGAIVYSGGADRGLNSWDAVKGGLLKRLASSGGPMNELTYSPKANVLAAALASGTAHTWDASTGTVKATFTVGSPVYALALTEDASRVATGSADGLVRVWDASGRQLLTLVSVTAQGDAAEWAVLTPEGYVVGTDPLLGLARWRGSGMDLATGPGLWADLKKPEQVAKSSRGDKVDPPVIGGKK